MPGDAGLASVALNKAGKDGERFPPSQSALTARQSVVRNCPRPNLVNEDVRAELRELLRELRPHFLSAGVPLSTVVSVCDPHRMAMRAFCGVVAVY
jgi:hypothetical protein